MSEVVRNQNPKTTFKKALSWQKVSLVEVNFCKVMVQLEASNNLCGHPLPTPTAQSVKLMAEFQAP